MSFEAHRLTVPAIRWLGLLPSDFDRLVFVRFFKVNYSYPTKDKGKGTMNL